ncbi:MAG: hypothetical protein RBJ76_20400 [Stenomitos frigidus ULC029]
MPQEHSSGNPAHVATDDSLVPRSNGLVRQERSPQRHFKRQPGDRVNQSLLTLKHKAS